MTAAGMERFGLYLVVTAPRVSYVACAEAAAKAGLRYVQLRMKPAAQADVIRTGREMAAAVRGSGTRLIVDDDPAAAEACGADGVHLGQSDMPLAEARARFPALGIFGLSTHNPEQARAAVAARPDYCGVGPVYKTPTKAIPDPVLGPSAAGAIIKAAPFTTVAIGGINAGNLREVLSAGAVNFAVVRDVCLAPDPYDAIRRLQDVWLEFESERRAGGTPGAENGKDAAK